MTEKEPEMTTSRRKTKRIPPPEHVLVCGWCAGRDHETRHCPLKPTRGCR